MGDSAKRATIASPRGVPMRCYGLQFLEGEMLALVGVSAGLKASLALSACCVSLRDTLATPTLDEQLFGGLYAALAGVDNPSDAFLQPPSHHNVNKRRCPPNPPALRSSAPHCQYPNNHLPLHLRIVGRTPSSPNSSSPLQAEAEIPTSVKRARSPSIGPFPPEAVVGDAARPYGIENTTHSALVRDCLPYLRSEGEGRPSTPAEAQQQRKNQPLGTAERTAWKMRLKEDMATGREPSKTFVFAGSSKGKQDVLLAVVPSTPPVVAITCTTELSLFSLDGMRLPVVAVSPRHSGRSGENTSTDDDDDDDGTPPAPAEPHQRDIRCLAASPTGDMVATGSLDCTIRARSAPGCDWVRRLRGHEGGVRCLTFHRTRLVSADSLGMVAAWDVFPVSRRLCKVQAHSDSVQMLTWTSGGEQLASGALDGSVVLWSMSAEGILVPVVTHGGLCHPYRLVAIGRCLAFTSSAFPSVVTGLSHNYLNSFVDGGEKRCGRSGDGNEGDDGLAFPVSKGAHISVVSVEPTSPTNETRAPGGRRVSTGLARLQHLVAGRCLGTVMLSQTESWAEESDSSADEGQGQGDDAFLGGGRVTYRPPRLCRIVSTERVTSFEDYHAAHQSRSAPCCEGGGGGGSGGESLEAPQADWVKVEVSRCWSAAGRQSNRPQQPDVDISCRGPGGKCDNNNSISSNIANANGEDLDGGAFCTCAVFVGRTLFLGYDTGFIYAHRASDGRRLYRLSMFGSVVHLVEAKGSLFAYASSGVVSRWSWGDEYL